MSNYYLHSEKYYNLKNQYEILKREKEFLVKQLKDTSNSRLKAGIRSGRSNYESIK